jgi:hypothetical protein
MGPFHSPLFTSRFRGVRAAVEVDNSGYMVYHSGLLRSIPRFQGSSSEPLLTQVRQRRALPEPPADDELISHRD